MKVLKMAHLNVELLKCRQHFIETREMALGENFDILNIFRIFQKLPTLVLRLTEGHKGLQTRLTAYSFLKNHHHTRPV